MSSNSFALTSRGNWSAGNGYEASFPDDDRHRNRQQGVPLPLQYRLEEGEGISSPWRLFEERVRTGPYRITRFPLQPFSPIRILILEGGTEERVNPRLRQFIRDSPPRVRGNWHLGPVTEPEEPGLTNEEFKKAMKKIRKQVYIPPPPKKRAWKRSLFGNRGSSSTNIDAEEDKNEAKQCTICLEGFVTNESVLVTPCNHMFHNDCLVPWVKGKGQCPVCRFVLCERQERALTLNHNYNNVVSDVDLAVDLVALLRAMEEAFNWVNLSR